MPGTITSARLPNSEIRLLYSVGALPPQASHYTCNSQLSSFFIPFNWSIWIHLWILIVIILDLDFAIGSVCNSVWTSHEICILHHTRIGLTCLVLWNQYVLSTLKLEKLPEVIEVTKTCRMIQSSFTMQWSHCRFLDFNDLECCYWTWLSAIHLELVLERIFECPWNQLNTRSKATHFNWTENKLK